MQPIVQNGLKIIIWCLLVGIVMYWLDIGPQDILQWFIDSAHWGYSNFEEFLMLLYDAGSWAFKYILIGATVVIPIAIIRYLMNRKKD